MIFMTGSSPARSFRRLGQQGHRARPTDRARELPLVPGTAPRDATRGDLAALRDEVAEPAGVPVGQQVHSVDAEPANHAVAATLTAGLVLLADTSGRPRGGLAAGHERDTFRDALDDAALLTVLRFPVP